MVEPHAGREIELDVVAQQIGHAGIDGVLVLAFARHELREVLDKHARVLRDGSFQRERGMEIEYTAGIVHALGRTVEAEVRVQTEALTQAPVQEQPAARIDPVAGDGAASCGKAQRREQDFDGEKFLVMRG